MYGPSLIETARQFDDKFVRLKALFHLPVRRYKPNQGWSCRLKNLADRPKALALIDELGLLRAKLAAKAPDETAILPSRLDRVYLEPMEATLVVARKMALLDYPEYALFDIEAKMLALNDRDDVQAAERELAPIREKVRSQLAVVRRELEGLKGIKEYAAFWEKRISGMRHWQAVAALRRKEQAAMHKKLVGSDFAIARVKGKMTADDYKALFARLAQPPAGEVVTEVCAKDWLATPAASVGSWGVGSFVWDEREMVAIGFPRYVRSQVNDFAEVRARVPVPKFTGRLMLDAFVNDTKFDTRWTQYRHLQFVVNDKLIWEEDASAARAGLEWVSVDVTKQAKTAAKLTLRFRLVDKRPVGCYGTVAFLGPVRLRAVAPRGKR